MGRAEKRYESKYRSAPPGQIADDGRARVLGHGKQADQFPVRNPSGSRPHMVDQLSPDTSGTKCSGFCIVFGIIFAWSAFACSVSASADEITLQVGRRFSVYVPSS